MQPREAMVYLCGCVLRGQTPDCARLEDLDVNRLLEESRFQSLSAMVCTGLEMAGEEVPAAFREEKAKAIRKQLLMDTERARLCAWMEEKGIWYLPLKGILLQEHYPGLGLRQMSDNDILFDASHRQEVRDFMKASGYRCESLRQDHHDAYQKPPVYHFEMHTALFGEDCAYYDYFASIENRLLPVEGKTYEKRLSEEDFYLFLTAHAAKHYHAGGTGLRTLADFYVFLRDFPGMKKDYVAGELETLGLSDFASVMGSAAAAAFGSGVPDDRAKALLAQLLASGTYGTVENVVARQRETGTTPGQYVWRRLFPEMEFYRVHYPFFYRHRWLLPAAWAHRLGRAVLKNGQKTAAELRAVLKSKTK